MEYDVDIVEKYLADNSPLPVYIEWCKIRAALAVVQNSSHNNAMDVICPTCKGAGFTPNIFDSKMKVPCILCNESGKQHQ
jgi:hypothetical protein